MLGLNLHAMPSVACFDRLAASYLSERMHMRDRYIAEHPDLAPLSPEMAVGPWHARAHIFSCLESMGARSKEGTGLTDGDNIEKLWAVLRHNSHLLKYMSRATWLDTVLALVSHLHLSTCPAVASMNVCRGAKPAHAQRHDMGCM